MGGVEADLWLPAMKGWLYMNNEQIYMQPENSSDRNRTYTVQEIATMLKVSVRTAYNLCETTKDFKVVRVGKCVRVNGPSFDRWLSDCDMADN